MSESEIESTTRTFAWSRCFSSKGFRPQDSKILCVSCPNATALGRGYICVYWSQLRNFFDGTADMGLLLIDSVLPVFNLILSCTSEEETCTTSSPKVRSKMASVKPTEPAPMMQILLCCTDSVGDMTVVLATGCTRMKLVCYQVGRACDWWDRDQVAWIQHHEHL